MGVPQFPEIALWWEIQCSKCRYRAEPKNGVLTEGTCNYICLTGHSRGCEMQNCERFEFGDRLRFRVDLDGLFRPETKAKRKRKVHKRTPSVCACGEWIDARITDLPLKTVAAGCGVSYDHFCHWRNTPGAVMSDEMVVRAAKFFGTTVEAIRKEEAKR